MRQADETFTVTLTGMQMAEISVALGLASLTGIVDPDSSKEIIDTFMDIVPGLRDKYAQLVNDIQQQSRDITDTDPL